MPQEVLVPGASSVHVVTGGNGGELRAGVIAMSRHPYGCRVIQRILEHCTLARVRDSVKAQAQAAALDLARDVYGNYISQHLLIHGTTEDRCGPPAPPQGWFVSGMLGCRVVQTAALGHARRMHRNYILQHTLGHTAL